MEERVSKRSREGYRAGPSDVIYYNWGSIIAYLQRSFHFHINDILEFAENNNRKSDSVKLAEHIFALIFNGARNVKLKNVRHIRTSDRLDRISGLLQHDVDQIVSAVGKNPPELTDIELELLAHQFICAIEDKYS